MRPDEQRREGFFPGELENSCIAGTWTASRASNINAIAGFSGPEKSFTALPDEGAESASLRSPNADTPAPTPPPGDAVAAVCRRIAARLPERTASPRGVKDSRKLLAGFAIPFSIPDDSGSSGCGWPGSRLTGDDVRKLNVLSNCSGWPCTELLHLAVGLRFRRKRPRGSGRVGRRETRADGPG